MELIKNANQELAPVSNIEMAKTSIREEFLKEFSGSSAHIGIYALDRLEIPIFTESLSYPDGSIDLEGIKIKILVLLSKKLDELRKNRLLSNFYDVEIKNFEMLSLFVDGLMNFNEELRIRNLHKNREEATQWFA